VTVILSHHSPHFGSVAKGHYESDILTASYCSDLSEIILTGAETDADPTPRKTADANWDRLWVHGHIHSSSDYVVGTTRILANPHGYGADPPGSTRLRTPGSVCSAMTTRLVKAPTPRG